MGGARWAMHGLAAAVTAAAMVAAPVRAAVPTAVPTAVPAVCFTSDGGPGSVGLVSQNFEPVYDAYDNVAADDFRLPETCRLQTLYIVGTHFAGIGPADSETVTIYRNRKGLPGRVVFADTLVGVDDDGRMTIELRHPVKLRPRSYWLAVQANQNFDESGQWGWLTADSGGPIGHPALWQNPGDGFETGCTTWAPAQDCVGAHLGRDLLFTLSSP